MPSRSEVLYRAMAMDRTDELRLWGVIRGRYIDAYVDAVQQMMNDFGVSGTAKRPTAREYIAIGDMAREDARSIVDTYNTDLQRKIDILLRDNPGAPLDAYRAYLNTWHEERMVWKHDQISKSSQSAGAEYGRGKFIEKNRLTAQMVTWSAIPPILPNSHKTCIERVRQGAVSWEIAKDWRRVHPNCRHIRKLVDTPALTGEVWRG